MKTLIVYFSFSGNNEVLAKELQSILHCDIFPIIELRGRVGISIFLDILFKRSPPIEKTEIALNQYDHIILVAPIWAGRIANPLKTFLKQEKENIRAYSFITLCGVGGNVKLRDELSRLTGQKPVSLKELPINELLPVEKKDKIKYTSGYKVQLQDVKAFRKPIESFLQDAVHFEQESDSRTKTDNITESVSKPGFKNLAGH